METMKFFEYMQYLTESTYTTKEFSPDVREFFDSLSYVRFVKDHGEEIVEIELDDIGMIGKYIVKVLPSNKDGSEIYVTFSLIPFDKSQKLVVLLNTYYSTKTNEYKTKFKNFIKTVTRIVEDIDKLNSTEAV